MPRHRAVCGGISAAYRTGHRRDYSRNLYTSYFAHDRLMFPVAKRDDRLPLKAGVVGIKLDDTVRAYPMERVAAAQLGRVVEMIGEDGRVVLQADADTGSIRIVESPESAQVVHTFWFTWAAYLPPGDNHFRNRGRVAIWCSTEPSLRNINALAEIPPQPTERLERRRGDARCITNRGGAARSVCRQAAKSPFRSPKTRACSPPELPARSG